MRSLTKFTAPIRFGLRYFTSEAESSKLWTIYEAKYLLDTSTGVYKDLRTGTWVSDNKNVVQKVAASQQELAKSPPRNSFVQAVIPLSRPQDSDMYLSSTNGVRLDRLMGDFDNLGGLICYHHNRDPALGENQKSPYFMVTKLVDKIEQLPGSAALSPYKDLYVSGKITWVGSSSLECTMQVEQDVDGDMQTAIVAKYLYVPYDPLTQKTGVVNALDPETPEEIELFRLGEEKRKQRKSMNALSLLKTQPTDEERLLIHDLFLTTTDLNSTSVKIQDKPENSVWMEDTLLKSVVNCVPEQRSLYNRIFGGVLMEKAYTLALTSATSYSNSKLCTCKSADNMIFHKAVEIGDAFFLTAQVVYTKGPDFRVHVHGDVLRDDGTFESTNDFYFSFDSGSPDLPRVVPKTYLEIMQYLVGKRLHES